MAILNEASMRIGDARGRLELERLRREREERRAQMFAQGLSTITQGGLAALQTGAQFATDYSDRQAAERKWQAEQAMRAKLAQEKAAREEAKLRIEQAKLDLMGQTEKSQATLRDAKVRESAALARERNAEAVTRLMGKPTALSDITSPYAQRFLDDDGTGAAPATDQEAALIFSQLGRVAGGGAGESAAGITEAMRASQPGAAVTPRVSEDQGSNLLLAPRERSEFDATVDKLVEMANQRADARERAFIANDIDPTTARAMVDSMGLRVTREQVSETLAKQRDTMRQEREQANLKAAGERGTVRGGDLERMESEAYGRAAEIVREGRAPTEEDIENLSIELGVTATDARSALARAFDRASLAAARARKTGAEAGDIEGRGERAARRASETTVMNQAAIAAMRRDVASLISDTDRMAPSMGWVRTRLRNVDESVTGGATQDWFAERGRTDVSGTEWGVYQSKLSQAVQNYAKILEGGRLTDADIPRYRDMLKKDLNPNTLKSVLGDIQNKLEMIERDRERFRVITDQMPPDQFYDITGTAYSAAPTSIFQADEDAGVLDEDALPTDYGAIPW